MTKIMNFAQRLREAQREGINKSGELLTYEKTFPLSPTLSGGGSCVMRISAPASKRAILWDLEFVTKHDAPCSEFMMEIKNLVGPDDRACWHTPSVIEQSKQEKVCFFTLAPYPLFNVEQKDKPVLEFRLSASHTGSVKVRYFRLTLRPELAWPEHTSGVGIPVGKEARMLLLPGRPPSFVNCSRVRHGDFQCDKCEEYPIVGVRFTDDRDPSYDLCEACYLLRDQSHPRRFRPIMFEDQFEENAPEASSPIVILPGQEDDRDDADAETDGIMVVD